MGSTATGLWVLWAWDNKPGASAQAREQWPADSGLTPDRGRPTLVMLVHPQCTCSRASLTELAELLARARPLPKTYVLFLKPAGVSDGRGTIDDGTPAVDFTVTDTGVGITPEQTARIFDPFTQADGTTTRKYGGTGLGLAIVSRFCQLMGGRVWVESQLGEGSRFTAQLPVDVLETAGEPIAAA